MLNKLFFIAFCAYVAWPLFSFAAKRETTPKPTISAAQITTIKQQKPIKIENGKTSPALPKPDFSKDVSPPIKLPGQVNSPYSVKCCHKKPLKTEEGPVMGGIDHAKMTTKTYSYHPEYHTQHPNLLKTDGLVHPSKTEMAFKGPLRK